MIRKPSAVLSRLQADHFKPSYLGAHAVADGVKSVIHMISPGNVEDSQDYAFGGLTA